MVSSGGQVTDFYQQAQPSAVAAPSTYRKGSILADWLSTTDHKVIGHLYLITSFVFFLAAGLMAMIMRAQLMGPDNHIVSDQQYNELFTMHGAIMLLLFATPLFVGLANEIMPLQIGAPDVAFPRLNLLCYYMFTFGGLILLASFLTPGGAPAFGWYAYSPLTSATYSPGVGGDMWIMGLTLSGLGTILSGVNFVTTILCMRAPGMTMFRMPIFTWNILLTSIMVLIAFPVLGRRAAGAGDRPQARRAGIRRLQRRGDSRGSTCSGSSAIPRSISWRSRSSASPPKSCRCSPASRCSATRAWSPRPSPSRACR